MSSRLTLILAVVLLLGALIAGYWGISLSQPQAPAADVVAPAQEPAAPVLEEVVEQVEQRVADEQRTAVVVLARDVPAWQALENEDLQLEYLKIAPPGSFTEAEQLIGRQAGRNLAAGSVLTAESFIAGGPLARMIRTGERAMAIEVNEVVGGGGHLAPTDYVDVMLYLRQDQNNREQTAQVVVPALRVLSVGRDLGPTNNGQAAQPPVDDDAARRDTEKVRSVVLAVPEKLLARLLLASEAGDLRLAVRSADEKRLASYYAGTEGEQDLERIDRQLVRFQQLALPRVAVRSGAPRAPARVPVFRGSDLSQQTP
tara:strand:- start:219 stop:1160 length:942 start_codon:yes stop_codon:yes gene_type:complete